MTNDYKSLRRCLCCGNHNLKLTLDLGSQPLANSFKATVAEPENTYPLAVNYCSQCSHLQLTHAVDANIIFKNYLYVSGTSLTMQNYFAWFADYVLEHFPDVKPRKVLEIGCNDGTQLNYFKKHGLETVGIDPAENIYPISSKNHKIICDFLTPEALLKVGKTPDIIYAQNVFAHQDNPEAFLKLCRNIMNANTLLFIQNSQSDMICNNEFDTIYHEHRNFFSIKSLYTLANSVGLNMIDVFKGTIHGGSNIFVFSIDQHSPARIQALLDWERINGLHDYNTYVAWADGARRTVNDLAMVLDGQRKAHQRLIVGYGAPAKGNTLLNFGNIDMDFIIDDNPLKQGKYTPGMSIPVVTIDELKKYPDREICFVPLAWNFFDEIVERIKKVRNYKGDVFIKYFPKITIS
jgi:SAM-dependent methyltransferase